MLEITLVRFQMEAAQFTGMDTSGFEPRPAQKTKTNPNRLYLHIENEML